MSRHVSEDILALFIAGDLPKPDIERVRNHIAECAACGQVISELHDTQSALRLLRREVVPATAAAILRERVLNEIGRQSAGWTIRWERWLFGMRWRYAICGVAAVALAATLIWGVRTVEQPHRSSIGRLASDGPAALARSAATPAHHTAPRRTPKAAKTESRISAATPISEPASTTTNETAEEPAQLMVKLLTDDPAVVIYWIIDEQRGVQ